MVSPRLLPALLLLAACGGRTYTRTYPEPTGEQVVTRLAEARARARSFKATTRMDYWLGDDRIRSKVLIMGEAGAKVRINFLSPAGDSVMADLACDGSGFVFVDQQNNCVLTGPCNADSIARFLRVRLAPDDFLSMATGTAPVLDGAQGEVTWDAKHGHEVVELTAPTGTQRIVLDGRDGRWDLVSSKRSTPDGKEVWSLEHKGFATVKDEAGAELRVPGKSRFVSPREKADLLVEWQSRTINLEISPDKFQLEPPAGLPRCGEKK
jgi:outer membrane biogenesis lipoprotein LolB